MHNITTLTEAEARAILADENAQYLPFRVINETGQAAVRAFIERVAADPAKHSADAWYQEAEQAANDALLGEDIGIEMRGMHTSSRNPETLSLDKSNFDWVLGA